MMIPLALLKPLDFILASLDYEWLSLPEGLSRRPPEATTPPVVGLDLNGVFIPTWIEMSEISWFRLIVAGFWLMLTEELCYVMPVLLPLCVPVVPP